MLDLFYITNSIEIAKIGDQSGIDRIFVDLERIGKNERQGGLDTVQSHHCIADIRQIQPVLKHSKLMVRINPIHNESKKEIDEVIGCQAEYIMLPYFKEISEVKEFLKYTKDRARAVLLVETVEAVENIDKILEIDDVKEIHIGLNDLHLGYKLKFMFELISNGTVERLCEKFNTKKIKYGFGGIARLGHGIIPAEYIITEHYRLGSTAAILSREFCHANKETNLVVIKDLFDKEIQKIRLFEKELQNKSKQDMEENFRILSMKIQEYVGGK